MAAVVAMVAVTDAGTDAIQPAIDAIAAAVKAHGPVRVPEQELALGAQVQPMVDTVAADIHAMFEAIAAMMGFCRAGREAGRESQGQGKPEHGDFG